MLGSYAGADPANRDGVLHDPSPLNEALILLTHCLDYKATVQKIAELAVASLAGWCIVDVIGDDGKVRRVAAAHSDVSKMDLVNQLYERYPARPAAPRGVYQVIRTRRSILVPEVTEEMLRTRADDSEHFRLISELGCSSYMCVPLIARGRMIGTVLLCSTSGNYGSSDLRLAVELARRFALAADNALIYQRAKEAIRVHRELLSITAHELRMPSASLDVQAALLTTIPESCNSSPEDSVRLRRVLEISDKEIKRVSQLVNQLLDWSYLNGGHIELNLGEVDLAKLAREVAGRFQGQIDKAGCSIQVEGDPSVVGFWDQARLERVLDNLISNAVKYGPGRPIQIHVSGKQTHGVLRIRDHGCGIAGHDRSRIFEPFPQLAAHSDAEGLGLGLYVCRMIIESHSGSIDVESEPGHGSTFMVRLPIKI